MLLLFLLWLWLQQWCEPQTLAVERPACSVVLVQFYHVAQPRTLTLPVERFLQLAVPVRSRGDNINAAEQKAHDGISEW